MAKIFILPDKIIYKPKKNYFCYVCKKKITKKHILRKHKICNKFYSGRFHINCLKKIDKEVFYCYCDKKT